MVSTESKRYRVRVDRETEVEVEERRVEEEVEEDEAARGVGLEEAAQEEVFESTRGEKARRIPRGPSAEEVRLHRITHCPYRSWCPKCVGGRGHQGAHTANKAPNDNTPMVSIDYCFLRRSPDDASVPV